MFNYMMTFHHQCVLVMVRSSHKWTRISSETSAIWNWLNRIESET